MWHPCLLLFVLILVVKNCDGDIHSEDGEWVQVGRLIKRQDRKEMVNTEYGTISGVDVGDGIGRGRGEINGIRKRYQLQFISLDPNSIFLPAILHAHMVFYVHTGSGRLSYSEGGEMKEVRVTRGDVYSLKSGTIFLMQSSLEPQRQSFRVNAIFDNADHEGNWVGPYSSIHELFQGFDKRILQAAFKVSEEVIEEVINASRTPPIVHAPAGASTEKNELWESETSLLNSFLGMKRFGMDLNQVQGNKKKKGKTKTFNFFEEDPDVENCNGWSTMVTSKQLHALKGSNIGVFMVNLSTSSMMGPHWNPIATEIGMVLEGRGMVRVVCSSNLTRPTCNNTSFLVEEGDIFVIPRYHPMAQMSFNNETLVFMGFSTHSNTNNHPQFLAGEASVLRALNKRVLEVAFNVNTTTIGKLLDARKGSTVLDCISCAEEEHEIQKREWEDRKRQEEQRIRQEEEEERKRREEEKERQRQEEEERKRREEEKERQEDEERKRREEEKERKRQEEEERKRREEEERRKQEEEERRRQEEEEEERRRQKEEKEQRRQEELEEEEEQRTEEEERRRQEDEEERRERERAESEEEAVKREEEEREREREMKKPQPQRREGEGEETEEEVATREEEERHPGRRWPQRRAMSIF